MSEIIINEIDNTTAGISSSVNNTVFLVGNVGSDYVGTSAGKFTLFTTLKEFTEEMGTSPMTYSIPAAEYQVLSDPFTYNPKPNDSTSSSKVYDPGFNSAFFLLQKGLQVLYFAPKLDTASEIETNDKFKGKDVKDATTLAYEVLTGIEPKIVSSNFVAKYTDVVSNLVTNLYTITAFAKEGESDLPLTSFTEEQWNEAIEQLVENGTYTPDGSAIAYDTIKYTLNTTDYTYVTFNGLVDYFNGTNFAALAEDLKDKGLYRIRFLSASGYDAVLKTTSNSVNTYTSKGLQTTLINVALDRKDAIAIPDHQWNLAKGVVTKDTITDVKSSGVSVATASSKGTMLSPWCEYTLSSARLIMPASFAYLEAFANAIQNNPTWYATAGMLRGLISGTPIAAYGDNHIKQLTPRTGVSVNPITFKYVNGNATVNIWGNRTLYNAPSDLKASSFLNISQLVVDLQKQLYTSSVSNQFEPNSDRTWYNFKSQIDVLLNQMKSAQGIKGKKIIRLQPTAKAQLRALIKIVPIDAIEDFYLTIELADTLEITEE